MKDPGPQSVDRRLAELSRDVVPPRNLWPEIARQIQHRRRHPPLLLAACVAAAAACLASFFTWAVLRRVALPAGLPIVAHAAAFDAPADAKYMRTRDDLERTFHERLTLLEPKTRVQIESSLQIIRQAHESIRLALLADPNSAVLEELWQSTWHDEIDLYDRVVQATQPTLTRS